MHEHPWLETAEALMRSRFAAVRDADAEWLLASWHPSTRPASLDLTDNPTWRGLQIIDTYSAAIGLLSSAASRPSPCSLPGAPTRR
jgi:uncharacterized protein YchJ